MWCPNPYCQKTIRGACKDSLKQHFHSKLDCWAAIRLGALPQDFLQEDIDELEYALDWEQGGNAGGNAGGKGGKGGSAPSNADHVIAELQNKVASLEMDVSVLKNRMFDLEHLIKQRRDHSRSPRR